MSRGGCSRPESS
eukprot:gene18587-biopygen5526